MWYADDLIKQAFQLAVSDKRKPKQANLRRAVSGAYYALFHEIADCAVRSVLSKTDASGRIGSRLRRVMQHKDVLKAARWFARPIPQHPPEWLRMMRAGQGGHPPPPNADLNLACEAFVDLLDARHRADYDVYGDPFSRDEALRLINDAKGAIARIRALHHNGDALVFMLGCLLGDGLSRNP